MSHVTSVQTRFSSAETPRDVKKENNSPRHKKKMAAVDFQTKIECACAPIVVTLSTTCNLRIQHATTYFLYMHLIISVRVVNIFMNMERYKNVFTGFPLGYCQQFHPFHSKIYNSAFKDNVFLRLTSPLWVITLAILPCFCSYRTWQTMSMDSVRSTKC